MIVSAQENQRVEPLAESGPVVVLVQIFLDLLGRILDSNHVNPRILAHQIGNDLLKDGPYMLSNVPVGRNLVPVWVVPPTLVDRAAARDRVAGRGAEATFALGPPEQLAWVGDDDSRGRFLRLERLDQTNHGALVYAARSADDAVGEDAELLGAFPEDDDDAGALLDAAADANLDVWDRLVSDLAQGQQHLSEALVGEAGLDHLADGMVHVEALAVVPAFVLGQEELEVAIWVLFRPDLIGVVDEVSVRNE